MKKLHKQAVVLVACLFVAALAAPLASAQSPSLDGYVPNGPVIQSQIESSDTPSNDAGIEPGVNPDDASGTEPVQASAAEELPFTGLDIGLLAAAGAFLLLVGFGMRHLTRGPDSV